MQLFEALIDTKICVQQAALHWAGRPLQYRRRARPLPRLLAAGRPQGGQPRARPGHGSSQGGTHVFQIIY